MLLDFMNNIWQSIDYRDRNNNNLGKFKIIKEWLKWHFQFFECVIRGHKHACWFWFWFWFKLLRSEWCTPFQDTIIPIDTVNTYVKLVTNTKNDATHLWSLTVFQEQNSNKNGPVTLARVQLKTPRNLLVHNNSYICQIMPLLQIVQEQL